MIGQIEMSEKPSNGAVVRATAEMKTRVQGLLQSYPQEYILVHDEERTTFPTEGGWEEWRLVKSDAYYREFREKLVASAKVGIPIYVPVQYPDVELGVILYQDIVEVTGPTNEDQVLHLFVRTHAREGGFSPYYLYEDFEQKRRGVLTLKSDAPRPEGRFSRA